MNGSNSNSQRNPSSSLSDASQSTKLTMPTGVRQGTQPAAPTLRWYGGAYQDIDMPDSPQLPPPSGTLAPPGAKPTSPSVNPPSLHSY
ncbi:hypothetical protein M407DRAFT_19219 [Tulasnella calospora MUT 4182]|uniref:Uncharacterized protein n=1 Tax=Tulasnella calospora MUT 4182 TaxID=1051891 RepID=A0A0C3LCR6_9AGAM|nr:hypothetical protein M407DRAFT_19219 [Tulasnella calospora MUT 4182]